MNKKEIENLIYDYHWMKKEVDRLEKVLWGSPIPIKSAGVAQYGIEAAMPKAQGNNSDPIYNEVVRRQKAHSSVSKLEEKVRFIQEHMHVITDEKEQIVLHKLLDGYSLRAISRITGNSFSKVRTSKDNIARQLYEAQQIKSHKSHS